MAEYFLIMYNGKPLTYGRSNQSILFHDDKDAVKVHDTVKDSWRMMYQNGTLKETLRDIRIVTLTMKSEEDDHA